MTGLFKRARSRGAIFWSVCVAAIGVEAFVVFVDRHDTFSIKGAELYDVTEFGTGSAVSQAFYMRGDGLNAIRFKLRSGKATTIRLQWTLWRGHLDDAPAMTRAAEHVETIEVRPGVQWARVDVARDSSSNDRWYTLQVKLRDPTREAEPPGLGVSIVASHDNPDRGGVLWIDEARQPGSLLLYADRRGRTLYRRFQAEVEPKLPPALRHHAVQWALIALYHWAFIIFAHAVMTDAPAASRWRP